MLVDITKDVTAAPCEYEKQVPEEIVRQSDTITEQDMDRAVEMIRKASKPFIFVGGGAVLYTLIYLVYIPSNHTTTAAFLLPYNLMVPADYDIL